MAIHTTLANSKHICVCPFFYTGPALDSDGKVVVAEDLNPNSAVPNTQAFFSQNGGEVRALVACRAERTLWIVLTRERERERTLMACY